MSGKDLLDVMLDVVPITISLISLWTIDHFKKERASNARYEKLDNVVSKFVDLNVLIEDILEDMDFYDEKLMKDSISNDEIDEIIDDEKIAHTFQKIFDAIIEIRKAVYYVSDLEKDTLLKFFNDTKVKIWQIQVSFRRENDPTRKVDIFLNAGNELRSIKKSMDDSIEKMIKKRDSL